MQTIQERTTIQPAPPKARRTGLMALIVVLIVAAAGITTWLLVRGEQTATDVAQDYAAAMRADDMDSVAGFDASTVMGGFVEWQIAMKLEPSFTDCAETVGASTTRVSCTVTAGDDYFYTVISGTEMATTISGNVDDDGVLTGQSWPPPSGLVANDIEFRNWVKGAHPEMESQMWGLPGYLGLKMTRESGELRMQLLDEFLASR
jgi:hypothetical protein